MNGSQGNKACSVCGSSMPHMPWGTDSCEWDPKHVQLAKDRAKTVEELVTEVSGLSTRLHDALAREAALQELVSQAYLAGALAMREKIARALETSPRKAIYECATRVRNNVKPVSQQEAERFLPEARLALREDKP